MSSDQPIQIPPTPQGVGKTSTNSGTTSADGTASRIHIHWPTVADGLLAFFLLALVFLVSATAIRHDEFWRHLATGRLIADGDYTFGSDPLAFPDPDRAWVNPSWLFDLGLYAVYSIAEGPAVVILKALLVSLIFGLILMFKRKGGPMWMWALISAVGLIALAPMLTPQPILITLLFLVLTLRFLIFADPKEPAWQLPMTIGVLFAFWANCDRWFILGPLLMALWAAGAVVQRFIADKPEITPEDPSPLPESNADLKRCGLALVAGLVGTLLNPHFIWVWRLPAELASSELAVAVGADPVYRPLFESPFSASFYEATGYSNNPMTAIAYYLLLALGLIALGLNIRRVRGEVVAVWVSFAILSLLHARAVPFFAVVSVVLTGLNFAEFGRRWLEHQADEASSAKLDTSTLILGRTFGTFALLGLLFCAWPGWLNSQASDREIARRVGFDVRYDESLLKTAEALKGWRESGALPEEVHGLSDTAAFAHYCAWFAPSEPSFFDHRYEYRAQEAADYAELRLAIREFGTSTEEEVVKDALERIEALMQKHDASYLVFTEPNEDRYLETFGRLLRGGYRDWVPWYFDGQTAIFGWKGSDPELAEAFRYDVIQDAFGPEVIPVPPPTKIAAPEDPDFWVRYAFPAPWLPLESGRSQAMTVFAEVEFGLFAQQQYRAAQVRDHARRAVTGGHPIIMTEDGTPGQGMAALILAIRLAREAIAKSPDHPRPYFALAGAYEMQAHFLAESLRLTRQVEHLRQNEKRLPPVVKDYLGSLPNSVARYHQMQFLSQGTGYHDLTEGAELLDTLYARQVLAALDRCRARMPEDADAVPDRFRLLAIRASKSLYQTRVAFGQVDMAEHRWKETIPLTDDLPEGTPTFFKEYGKAIRKEEWQLPPDVYLAVQQMGRGQSNWGLLSPEDMLTRLDDMADLAMSAPGQSRVDYRFAINRALGRSEAALTAVRQAVDTQQIQDELGEAQRGALLGDFITLEIQSGKVEQAIDDLDALLINDDGQSRLEQLDDFQREFYRELRFRSQLMVGRYDTAIRTLDRHNPDMLFRSGIDPVLRLELAGLIPLGRLHPWVNLVRDEPMERVRELLTQQLASYARKQLRRGLVLLEAGRVEEARLSFESAVRPFGVGIGYPTRPIADAYLRVIPVAKEEEEPEPEDEDT